MHDIANRALFWLPSDVLLDDSMFIRSIFRSFTATSGFHQVHLPFLGDASKKTPFNQYQADKIAPDLLIYESHNPFRVPKAFPCPIIATIMTIYEPKRWFHEMAEKHGSLSKEDIDESVAKLTISQRQHVNNSLFWFPDWRLIMLYLTEAEGAFAIEELVGDAVLKRSSVIRCRRDGIEHLAVQLREFLEMRLS